LLGLTGALGIAGKRGARSADVRAADAQAAHDPEYVEGKLCADCHHEESRAWTGSHHDRAMEEPSPASVLGDFSGTTFEGHGLWARFRREGEVYWIDTRTGNEPARSYRVRYTFGVSPLQQYLLELREGRLQAFTVAWDTRKKAWFHVQPERGQAKDDPYHWSGIYQNWNSMCADCHSTGLRKNYDAQTDGFSTRFEAIDVGCQSCHGPGSRHVAWAKSGARGADPGLVRSFQKDDPATEIESCAACHARRSRVSAEPRAGASFWDEYRPALLEEHLYFADGQVRDEVFEYGSFAQSRMYQHGVRCSDCHEPHGLEAESGNALCTKCHSLTPKVSRFTTLALKSKDFDSPAHHHHSPGSEGARCVSCHMPERTYMQVHARRDHSIRIPRPDLSLSLGTPNACTQSCHAERGDAWARDQLAAWFPGEKPRHYGEVFHAARSGKDATTDLAKLVLDESQPAIVRATALDLLARSPLECIDAAARARKDPSPLVRAAAIACAEGLAPGRVPFVRWVTSGLSDERALVRQEAARILSNVPGLSLGSKERERLAAVRAKLEARHRAELDLPDGSFHLAVLANAEGATDRAMAGYRRALELDAAFTPAAFNLATLYETLGQRSNAEATLLAALARTPDDAELHYSLALVRAGLEKFEEAALAFEQAERRNPERPRLQHNYGLVLTKLGRTDEARVKLERARELESRAQPRR
jgi:tetratricopeptide (TPR) repeat protein